MIKLYSLYNGAVTDITNVIKSISCSGDKAQAARKLDITLAYPIWDRNQPRTQIAPGTKVWLLLDGKEIFRGIAWDREINSSSEELTFPALGNWDCRTGYAVNTEIFYVSTLQNAVMFIDGDTHTWEPGTGKYTMSLNLSFGNKMDSKG